MHLADLAGQEGILWVRVEAAQLDLGATADRGTIRRLIGDDAAAVPRPARRRAAGRAGRRGGPRRRRRAGRCCGPPGAREEVRTPRAAPAPARTSSARRSFGGQQVLALVGHDAGGAATAYGRLHILKSLAPLDRSEALTRRLFYGGVTLSFVLVLLLLNVLLSRMVLVPVRRVNEALARAATGRPLGAAAGALAATRSGASRSRSTAWWASWRRAGARSRATAATSRRWWRRARPSCAPRRRRCSRSRTTCRR